jgi:hypothetical protein
VSLFRTVTVNVTFWPRLPVGLEGVMDTVGLIRAQNVGS